MLNASPIDWTPAAQAELLQSYEKKIEIGFEQNENGDASTFGPSNLCRIETIPAQEFANTWVM